MSAIPSVRRSRVAIADDHLHCPRWRARHPSSDRGIQVVGEAEDGQSAIALIRQGGVDVLLLDLAMPGRAGRRCCVRVLDEAPELRVIVFTAYDPVLAQGAALALSASGCVASDSRPAEILDAIHRSMLRPVQKRVASNEGEPSNQSRCGSTTSCIRLVRGESVTDIAKDLHLS